MKSISKIAFFALTILMSFSASLAMEKPKSALKEPKPAAQPEATALHSLCNELKNAKDVDGATRMLTILKERSSKNPHVSSGNANGDTPLYLTVQNYCQAIPKSIQKNAYLEATKILLNANASPDAQNQQGRTSLHTAVFNDQAPIIQILLNAKADPKIVDSEDNSALYLASLKPTSETAKLLNSLSAKKQQTPEILKKDDKKEDGETFEV